MRLLLHKSIRLLCGGCAAVVHCRNFTTHAQAQQWFVAHGGSASNDVAGLDGNHNGVACEDLP